MPESIPIPWQELRLPSEAGMPLPVLKQEVDGEELPLIATTSLVELNEQPDQPASQLFLLLYQLKRMIKTT